MARLQELAVSGKLLDDMLISIYRISLGFLISTAFALADRHPDRFLPGAGRRRSSRWSISSATCRSWPSCRSTILWTGTGDTQKFLIIFIGTFFQQVLLVMDNVKSVPRDFINLGRTLQMPEAPDPRTHHPALAPCRRSGIRCASAWAGPGPGWWWPNWWPRPRASATASPRRSASSRPTPSSATCCCWAFWGLPPTRR